MKNSYLMKSILLIFAFAASADLHAQRRRPPAKKPIPQKATPASVRTQQKAVQGKEESELSKVPAPKSAKLPETKREFEDINKNPLLGTVTIAFSAGMYNFTNNTSNSATNTQRSYTLPFDFTTLIGMDLAFRLGHDKDKDYDTGTGFHYYRSNRGVFTDFELGFKTQRSDSPSRYNMSQTQNGTTTNTAVDLGATAAMAQNITQAGVSPQLRQAAGGAAANVTMAYANVFYHFTPLNFIMNFGSAFRWFDASVGPSIRVWYYQDYSDPVRYTTRNDDATSATLMMVYRQYIQFHPQVRLRTHFYFPALSYFGQLAKSGIFNETEYIVNTALEICAIRVGSVGLVVSGGYEGHWWFANPYSSNSDVRTGFVGDSGVTDANYAGFKHTTRTSWEAFATVAAEIHFDGN